jgi:phage terminase large subunit
MEAIVRGGRLLRETIKSPAKVVVHEGGSSSGKTISLLQEHLRYSFENYEKVVTVARLTMPAMKRGPIRDFKNVLEWAGARGSFSENKTDNIWTNTQTGTQIEFMAVDDEQKARGPRRDVLHVNEANEIPLDTFRQLSKRTKGRIYIDYNPSLFKWWIDTEVLTREDAQLIHSTYKDNGFLMPGETSEIEAVVPTYKAVDGTITKDWELTYEGSDILISGDPYEWSVFGLGRRGAPTEAIYPICHSGEFPDSEYVYGCDFGYEHGMVLIKIARVDADPRPRLYYDQIVHGRGMTTSDLLDEMDRQEIDKDAYIYCDSARPDAIDEMGRRGYNAHPATKGPGSVKDGIDFMKQHDHYFTARSERSKTQFLNYRRKKIKGVVMDDPIKLEDDAPDAARYGATMEWGRNQFTAGLL